MHGNRPNPRTGFQQKAHEAFIVPLLPGLRQRRGAAAAQCGTRGDLDLPTYFIAAGRLQLPSFADLLGLWRRGDRALRTVGRRMDDAGAAVALSALGHLGNRQCSADKPPGRAMVSAMAVRTLARRQRPLKPCSAAVPSSEMHIATGNQRFGAVLVRCLPGWTSTMRWKIPQRGYDRRHIDLLAALAILIVIVVLGRYFGQSPKPVTGAFIEPSQTVRW